MGKEPENVCEERVFDELFVKHSKDLHNFLHYKFGADNNPKDLVQEAFLKLWDNCSKITPDKAKSFLFTVANNKMLNEISKKKTAMDFNEHKPKAFTEESPQYIMEEKEYMDKLNAALESLTEDQRVTFMMNRVEGKKHKEIAEMLGISSKAVEKRIYKALSILQKKIGNI